MKVPGAITSLDLRCIEDVLEMHDGYVLDFTDRTFAEFFEDLEVDINDEEFCVDGTSKAKRLRRFVRGATPTLAGRALQALLEHRLATTGAPDEATDRQYREIIKRLLVASTEQTMPAAVPEKRELDFGRALDPDAFRKLGLEERYAEMLLGRMREAQACLSVGAHLATVILCGSVLEGLCLAFGRCREAELRRGFQRRINQAPPPLDRWTLWEWVAVLGHVGHLSPNIEKFGHALRDFRNYVHPGAELRNGFAPNQHTASIGFQVVLAAVDDLAKSKVKNEGNDG